ncbi:unnamed protein product, partial [Hapterophycus canaliculatus]
GTTPEKSAVVIFGTTVGHPTHGHIGIVDDINGNQIKVRDSNWAGDEIVREHWMSATNDVLGYVYCDGAAPDSPNN